MTHVPWELEFFEDRFVDVKGIKVRYWQLGQSGPPVVLVHGIGASVEYWVRNITALAAHYRVYALDIVGFGRSDKPKGYNYEVTNVARFMADFLDAMGLDSVHWVANSMGGLVVLVTTAQYPERTRSLTLVDAAGFGGRVTWVFRLMSLPIVGEIMSRLGRRGFEYVIRHLFTDPEAVPAVWVDALVDIAKQPGQQTAFLAILRSGITVFGVKRSILAAVPPILTSIRCPVLVVWGRLDRILPFEHGLNAIERVPGAQLHVWNDAGHLPMLEKAPSFNRVVLNFLDEVST
jgi:pimeloyl-ACP methyl ester carboxylesterase